VQISKCKVGTASGIGFCINLHFAFYTLPFALVAAFRPRYGGRAVMLNNIVNIGYGNMVMAAKVVAVLSPDSAPMRRLKDEAKERKMLIDATQGRKTRAIIITDSDHIILSAVQVETLMLRFSSRVNE
jgi:regulator of extracellular matrix RemA (YlzA/DUF370 family)